jgi:C1A family cysteine protease/predicted secreted protein
MRYPEPVEGLAISTQPLRPTQESYDIISSEGAVYLMKLTGIHVNKRLALLLTLLLLSSLLFFTNAIASPPSDDPDPFDPAQDRQGEVRLSAKDDSRQIELNEGQVLVISLESNPSTGYMWEVEEADERILHQTGKAEFEPELPAPMESATIAAQAARTRLLGAPSKQILRFEAVAAGQTTLRLVYRRPWEQDVKPARTFSLQVQGVGPFTHVNSPTPTPTAEPSILHPPSSILHSPLGLPAAYNWCDNGGCTPVKDQGSCGSCWAFGTVGPLESNIRIRDGGVVKDLSEQYLLSCNTDGWSCRGGWWAHDYHWWKPSEPEAGAVYENDFPYMARDDPCIPSLTHHEKINSWTYVGPEDGVPSVAAIKQAIYDHGPVSVAVCAGSAFQNYSGGVFQTNEYCSGDVNHAVVLVGWDDNQGTNGIWYLKNSWGPGWGESGYMRIKYGTSNVGYSANYIVYSSSGCQDAYESDDTYTNAKTTTVNGATQHHTFHENGDMDWAKFTVTAGTAYTITTSNLETSNDTVLELYDSNGTTKLRDDDCVGLTSCINNWTAPDNGTYFIRVRNSTAQGDCTGYGYDLVVVSDRYGKSTEIFLPIIVQSSSACSDTQVVQNGGFESGDTIWVQSSGPYYIVGPIEQGYVPHSGLWSAWFGGYNYADDRLYQTINIPAGTSSARLVLYLYIETSDSTSTPYDYFHVELQNASGETLQSFLWADNTMSSGDWYRGTATWSNFSSHAGQTRRLFFQGTTDFSYHTNFFVDDVTLWTYCGGLPAEASEDIGPNGWTWEKLEAPSSYTSDSYNEKAMGERRK